MVSGECPRTMLHYEYLVLCPGISGIRVLHYYFISFVGGLQGI